MNAPAPYAFDSVFALDAHGQERAPSFSQEDVDSSAESARMEGFQSGHAAGRAEAISEIEARLASSAESIVGQLSAAITQTDERIETAENVAVDLAVTSARKLARGLVARFPLVEIVQLVREALDEVREVPHVVLKLNEDLADPMSERMDPLIEEAGISGRVIVLGDPDIPPGDATIEWADGGMTRNLANIEHRIDEAVKRFVMDRNSRSTSGAIVGKSAANPEGNQSDE